MAVDPAFAQYLRDGAMYALATDALIEGLWEELARETQITTPLAIGADALAEGVRQLTFLGGPLVIDEHLVSGLRSDLYGKPITLTGDRLGYAAGATVFVIGVAEADETETTTLTVMRKLT